MRIYFVYRKIITGGCELLIERLSRKLKEHSIDVRLAFQSIDKNMKERYEAVGVHLCQIDNWNRSSFIELLGSEAVNVITFVWSDFLICNIKKENIHTIFYAVHYQAFEMGRNKSKLIRNILVSIAKRGIDCLDDNHQIVCMDEQTINYTKKFYGYNSFQAPILRLAIDVVPEVSHTYEDDKVRILTIARAEFPFKGYILGLIDWFATTTEGAYLTIISYGPDECKISEKINDLDENVKKRISFIGKTDYTELELYYQSTDLYVGMGTTVLDAALRGIISIPVRAYTLELITDKYLHEDYSKVALDEGTISKFDELYEGFKLLDSNEKRKLSAISRECVINNYSTAAIVDKLIELLKNANHNQSTVGLDMVHMYHEIKSLIKGE